MEDKRLTVESKHLKEYKNLPHSPGIYKFYDKERRLLYIGKARDLKKRVSSYFQEDRAHNYKTQKMTREVAFFGFFCVDNEQDALFLERNLIQKHQPKYNIMFRDDKSYPYLCITEERFPRLLISRRYQEKKGHYYGPHTNVWWLRSMLNDLRKDYKIRTCNLLLSEAAIRKKKYRVCLEYHLGNCAGPCEGLQEEAEYNENMEEITRIIKGEVSSLKQDYKDKILHYVALMNFEKAQTYKERLRGLERFQSKSIVDNPKKGILDFFAWKEEADDGLYVHYLRTEDGVLMTSENLEIENVLGEKKEALAPLIITHILEKHGAQPREIVSNVEIASWDKKVRITVPKRGDKKKLLELAIKNVLLFREKRKGEKGHDIRPLAEALGLEGAPRHIECFDVSNEKSHVMVASVVCFRDGKASKKDYRRMKIRTVQQQDDCACLREAVHRRYKRLVEEDEALPDLVVVDGGKGQLNAAIRSLQRLGLEERIPVLGIAKKREELHIPGKPTPLCLPKEHSALHLLQNMRDEAHRFAVRYLRKAKSMKVLKGPKRPSKRQKSARQD